MIVKKGVVKTTSQQHGNVSEYVVVSVIGNKWSETFICNTVSGNGHVISTHNDVDMTNADDLNSVFDNTGGPYTYEWVEPFVEVDSVGGGSSPLDVYPVGIEITTTDTAFNPMKVWGGTWTVTPAGAKRVWKRTA